MPSSFGAIDKFIVILFCIDIVLNFNTGIVVDEDIVMKRAPIFRQYTKFWFWVDVLATLPDFVANFMNVGLIRVMRGMRFYKMLKAIKLVRSMRLIRSQGMVNTIMSHFELTPVMVFVFYLL